MRIVGALVALFALAALTACSPQDRAGPPTPAIELTVFAAASLKVPLEAVRSAYILTPARAALTVSTDSSAALEAKLEQGAQADVFLSADTSNPARLAAAGLTAENPVPFAGNRLAIVVPASNPARISSPVDLVRPGVKVVAAGDAVPISEYARRLVAGLAREPGYPADFATRYAANVVSKEDNVGSVLAKVALGEADAGVVYATDAKASDEVRTIPIPADANPVATYAGVVVRSASHPSEAADFLRWLAGPDGQAVLGPLGFSPPTASSSP